MEAQQFSPCPWLLDDAGAIEPGRPRVPSRCGADPARGELSNQIRERRCLTGSACEIRDAREAALGPLAATLAPGQPVGDAALLYGDEPAQPRASRPWGRLLLVAALAALLVIGGGPLAGAVGPVVDSLIGAADASAEPSVAPSDSALPTATPSPSLTPSPTPTATPSPSLTPSPTPTATTAPSSASGMTYVVKKGEGLYSIACSLPIGCGAWKEIAELNGIPGPDYVIKRGQVLKLP
ncbi:MAG: LysM domain-containing protein [Chloroflexi bacterium]|nr:LysM domain-containing protein [Chloroflexota bacterium]